MGYATIPWKKNSGGRILSVPSESISVTQSCWIPFQRQSVCRPGCATPVDLVGSHLGEDSVEMSSTSLDSLAWGHDQLQMCSRIPVWQPTLEKVDGV